MPVRYVLTFENRFLVLEIFDVALTSLLPAVPIALRIRRCTLPMTRRIRCEPVVGEGGGSAIGDRKRRRIYFLHIDRHFVF